MADITAEDFSELVRQARTYRRFDQGVAIPDGALERWVGCARVAPSGKNRQPLRFVLVQTPEDCARVYDTLGWAGALPDWPGPEEGERPRGYIVICSLDADQFTPIDVGIMSQTIKLAAQAEGFGSCMFKSFKKGSLARELGIADGPYDIEMVMAFGKPVEQVAIEPLAADAQDKNYWRDDRQVHHVPKYALDDLIIGRGCAAR
jgi:nitroreductase